MGKINYKYCYEPRRSKYIVGEDGKDGGKRITEAFLYDYFNNHAQ